MRHRTRHHAHLPVVAVRETPFASPGFADCAASGVPESSNWMEKLEPVESNVVGTETVNPTWMRDADDTREASATASNPGALWSVAAAGSPATVTPVSAGVPYPAGRLTSTRSMPLSPAWKLGKRSAVNEAPAVPACTVCGVTSPVAEAAACPASTTTAASGTATGDPPPARTRNAPR
jgi:hypothetical protein